MYSSIAFALCLLSFVTAVDVEVGFQGGLVFNPANITAPNGTLVNFLFTQTARRHSVTQSSFENPCTYLAASGDSPAGFDSGEQSKVQFTLNITDDTKPIWYHCKEMKHCGTGMVGSINAPTSGNTYEAFLAAAKAIGSSQANGGEGGPITGGVGGVATAPPSSLGSSTPTSAANSSSGSGSGSPTGTATSSTTKPSNSALRKQIANTFSTLFLGMLAVVFA